VNEAGYSMSAEVLIETIEVSRIYNPGMPCEVKAVDRISLKINRSDVVVIKGPSGSGKTTLLSLIGCMSRPTEGKVLIKGKDAVKLPESFLTQIRRDTFGFIFQQLHLIEGITVEENVMLPMYPLGARLDDIKDSAEKLLKKLDLLKKKSYKIKQLSGGEKQRTAIARALINNPEVILADEPTAHLDTALSEEFMSILYDLNQEGKTLIIATHDPLVYQEPYITRIIEMRDEAVL